MIIQCPKCNTKFSVSTELIGDYDQPRFHCSRCDNVFDLNAKQNATFEAEDLPPPVVPPREDGPRVNFEAERTPPAPTPSSSPSLTPKLESAISTYSPISSASTTEPSRSLQIPKEINNTMGAPHEAHSALSSGAASPKTASPASLAGGQISFPFDRSSGSPTERAEEKLPFGTSIGSGPGTDFTLIGEEDTSRFRMPAETRTQNLSEISLSGEYPNVGIGIPDSVAIPNRLGPWRSFMVMAIPMIAIMLGIGALSFYLVQDPSFAQAFARNISASQPKFPPAGLHLTDLEFHRVILDSGEVVHTISGTLKNNSSQTFREINLEGFAFDKEGKLLARTKINAAASLGDTNIKSLPVEMIKGLQDTAPNNKYQLPPSTDHPFTLALLDEGARTSEIAKASYFSARVHSVKN